MSDLNLLPSEAKFQAEKIRLKRLASNFSWLISGIWLVIVIILFGLNLLAQLNENQLNKKYLKVADQYKGMSQDILKNQQVKHQAKVVAMVLKERFEYGSSMEKIKGIFSDNIIINNFNLESGKVYKVEAVVPEAKNLDEVEKYASLGVTRIGTSHGIEIMNSECSCGHNCSCGHDCSCEH